MACAEIKQSHESWRLWAFVSIAMYPAIHTYDDQAIDDMSKESEKKTIV